MRKCSGQSLTEILVALAIGVAFINVGIMAMATANVVAKVNKANNFALALLKSQGSAIKTITENGWHSIADLTIGKHYKLAKQNNSLVIQPGEEEVFDEKQPVAQWNFDEGSGTTAYDNVGTNNGTLINSPTWQTSSNCVNGSCLSFVRASSQGISLPSGVSDLNNFGGINGSVTIEAWIKILDNSGYNGITQRIGGVDYFSVDSNGFLRCMVHDNTNNVNFWPISKSVIPLNLWTHVIFEFTGGQGYKFFINGVLDQSISNTNLVLYNYGSDAYLAYAETSYLNGSMDNINVYNYALTDSQVKQHYNAGLNRLGLVSQWGMDEGSGLTAYDSQGTNNGTLTNGPTWQSGSSCVSGSCLSFDGSSNYVDAGNGTNLNITNVVTLAAWIKSNSSSQDWGTVVGKGFETSANYSFEVASNWIRLTTGNGTSYSGTDLYYPVVGQWFYMVGVFTTVGSTTKLDMYINGAFSKTDTKSWPLTVSATNFGIGHSSYNTYFNGSIDDVRIYNRALSTDEIANQYKDGYTKYFYVNNVSRDIASDPTASTHNLETTYNANHDDPNTKKIVNVTRYLLGTPGRVNTQEQYLARTTNINSLIQTDWSGNSGVTGPEINFGNNYASASNLTLSTASQMSLTSTASNGILTSTIIDTQSINGSGYFNLLWQGNSLCSGCSVKFQIAASNSNSGPWTYYGPTATSDYYIPSGPGITVPITYAGQYSALSASVQNKRYIRYQITLVPASSTSPVVKDVIINYAP